MVINATIIDANRTKQARLNKRVEEQGVFPLLA